MPIVSGIRVVDATLAGDVPYHIAYYWRIHTLSLPQCGRSEMYSHLQTQQHSDRSHLGADQP